jgi:ATP-dependent DNA helicase DinG
MTFYHAAVLDDVRRIFAKDGPIATAIGGHFEPRSQQIEMALAVARTMESKSHLLAEAGTGVGKSFAYLVPAMLRCLRGETVVVATNTISLQEQLIHKDVPLLREMVDGATERRGDEATEGGDSANVQWEGELDDERAISTKPSVRPVLVKGRGNYVSIRRLKLASERQDKMMADPAARRSLHVIEDWARETLDGTLSTLPALERMGVWDKVQSDSGNCMGRKCSNYDRCFYQTARAKMEGANLLITNHALFFADLAMRVQDIGFLPRYDHVILDEAHCVEDVASEHFGRNLAEGRVMHLLTTLCHPRTGKGYLPQLALIAGDPAAVERAMQLAIMAQNETRAFFEAVLRATKSSDSGSGFAGAFGNAGGRLRVPGAVDNTITPIFKDLALRLTTLRDLVKNEPDKFELNAYAQRAQMIAEDAHVLVEQSLPGCAYWVETSGDDGAGFQKVTLACAPVEVAALLKENLFSKDHSVVLTSATLATKTAAPSRTPRASVGPQPRAKSIAASESGDGPRFVPDGQEDRPEAGPTGVEDRLEAGPTVAVGKDSDAFSHARDRLGADGADTLQVGSPFDYANQVEMIVDLSPPSEQAFDPFDAGDTEAPLARRDWRAGKAKSPVDDPRHIAERVVHHVRETDGGAFVLFTSLSTLRQVARLVRDPLSRLGHPVLAQTVDGSRTAILEQFRQNERSVLLGAASFWQGVDVRGRGLRNVIITKLPFDPPDRPLTQARHELIASRGGDSFRQDTMPRAIIRFKQGFGRLVRSASDKGRVVVLDPRLVRSGYGRKFLDALPPGVRLQTLD